jgi:hypothetical protein
VQSSESFPEILHSLARREYFLKYLSELGAQSCIVENDYVDRDYMIDYQKYYSRAWESVCRRVTRYHFFSEEIKDVDVINALNTNDKKYFERLNDIYLGFLIIKPIKVQFKKRGEEIRLVNLVGRTLLKTNDDSEEENKRHYIPLLHEASHEVSLFGIPLKIKSIPYQAQDRGVSACATIALWVALQSITRKFELPHLSPSEITEVSSLLPSDASRTYPQEGLSILQMINCIRAIKLEVEIIRNFGPRRELETLAEYESRRELVPIAVRAYLNMGIPLIAILQLTDPNRPDKRPTFHAAVITGYKCDKNDIMTDLYVHDDQLGPYCHVRVGAGNNFMEWHNEWEDEGFVIKLQQLIIPVYSKMRLVFHRMVGALNDLKKEIREKGMGDPRWDFNNIKFDLYLSSIQDYKKDLLGKNIKNKTVESLKPLPRFLWIIKIRYNNIPIQERVYDGTATFPIQVSLLVYNTS